MSKISLSTKEQILFFKQFGLLLQGGVSLPETLQILRYYLKGKRTSLLVQRLTLEIEQGRRLSQALASLKTFNATAISLIEIGETTGTLAQSLAGASGELEQRYVVKKKITAALIYPTMVIVATGGVIGLLIFYVFPKILPVFDSVHQRLPFTTRLLIAANTAIRHRGWYIGIAAIIMASILWIVLHSKRLKKSRDYLLLALPFIGRITKNYILIRFCGTLGKLLQRQVPLIKAVVITANTIDHTIYKQRIIALSMAVNRGHSLAQFMETEPDLFPNVLRQLVAVGEKTGTLGENLIFLCQLYEQEINDIMARFSIVLEPLMMIIIGSLVGFVAISIITPIYQITQNIHA